METKDKVKLIAKTLSDKKADDIDIIEIGDLTILTDYFVIASASNTNHEGMIPDRIEGYQTSNWIVIDYGDVIVHLFYRQTREFYNLDKLWSDGKKIDILTLLDAPKA